MSDVPGEILLEILSRQPVVSLLKFRCVSKAWKFLIDSNEFTRLHLNQSLKTNSNLNIIFKRFDHIYSGDFDSINETNRADFHELAYPLKIKLGDEIQVLGSCNGLLVLSNGDNEYHSMIILWNPSVKRFHEVPYERFECGKVYYMTHGFGYDAVGDDYKLVGLVEPFENDDNDVEVKVYSLKSDSWKRISDLPYNLNEYGSEGVFANGALHWIVDDKDSDIANLLIAFDLGTEEFRLVPIPEFAVHKTGIVIYVLGGCLSLKFDDNRDYVDIWVMKEYGVVESWSFLFTFDVSRFKCTRRTFIFSGIELMRPIAYSKCNKKVLVRLKNGDLTWYDLDKKSTVTVQMPGKISNDLCTCVQSLVLLNNGTCDFNLETVTNTRKKRKRKAKKKLSKDMIRT